MTAIAARLAACIALVVGAWAGGATAGHSASGSTTSVRVVVAPIASDSAAASPCDDAPVKIAGPEACVGLKGEGIALFTEGVYHPDVARPPPIQAGAYAYDSVPNLADRVCQILCVSGREHGQ